VGSKIIDFVGFMRNKKSFWGFLNRTADASTLQIERIRIAMLNALDANCDATHTGVDGAIRFARDLEALWYLRPDLLFAIASCRDQRTANVIMHDITLLFRGHLAFASSSRFGQL
jgi:hypothetical protein